MTPIAYPEELNLRYEVRGVLGQGAMGVVVLASDRRLHRDVAIKLVAAEHDPDELIRARREAERAPVLRRRGDSHPQARIVNETPRRTAQTEQWQQRRLDERNCAIQCAR